ncbi:hypothetical protein OROMI_011744 [Orobanche minor]
MEASGGNLDAHRSSPSSTSTHSRRHGMHISASNILRSPLSSFLEYTGILGTRSNHSESHGLLNSGANSDYRDHHLHALFNDSVPTPPSNNGVIAGEVSIRIIGPSEHEHDRVATMLHSVPAVGQLGVTSESFSRPVSRSGSAASDLSSLESQVDLRSDREVGNGVAHSMNAGDASEGVGNNRDSSSSYQRYDIQQAARWIEQVLPFALLLLVVFIRQHLHEFDNNILFYDRDSVYDVYDNDYFLIGGEFDEFEEFIDPKFVDFKHLINDRLELTVSEVIILLGVFEDVSAVNDMAVRECWIPAVSFCLRSSPQHIRTVPLSLILLYSFSEWATCYYRDFRTTHLIAFRFCVAIWIAVFMFKSNDIVRKQTALKGERKIFVLIGIAVLFTLHVVGIYWWHRNDDMLYPLLMLPPRTIPPFWHAIFIIMVNDTLVCQATMVFKCVLLIYYTNNGGRNYRRQGQMLTLVEYLLLLYRALLPAPVWYRFFLNKEYGSLFSSLMTGLYLTFKLTSVVEKVQSFITALRALSRQDIHYGAYATCEQVIAAGDLCAICQEKLHSPVLLRCKHIFCEECVSEWSLRENEHALYAGLW